MPELPEVETVRASLHARILNRPIIAIEPRSFPDVMGPRGLEEAQQSLVGCTIIATRRRGKYLVFDLDDETALVVHLRMTGQLIATAPEHEPIPYEHLNIRLGPIANRPERGRLDLRFGDQRKFGRILHLSPEGLAATLSKLGPEPLADDFTVERLADILRGRQAPIKSTLLDQHRIAGLGNIYVDEALFRARIHPRRTAGSLTPAEMCQLHAAIRAVLNEGIARRGTSFSSFRDGNGMKGENAGNLRVYGRGRKGLPCPNCGQPLTIVTVAGRTSHICPRCQPLVPPHAEIPRTASDEMLSLEVPTLS
jgi:formamidopyrimidine-DNA glycosylase